MSRNVRDYYVTITLSMDSAE